MIANFALTSLVIRKDDRWNRNVLRILKQGEQYQFNGYGDECRSLERNFFAAGVNKCHCRQEWKWRKKLSGNVRHGIRAI